MNILDIRFLLNDGQGNYGVELSTGETVTLSADEFHAVECACYETYQD